jgi:hypothetical protein
MSGNRTGQLHPVHRLIQALGRDPAVQQKFGGDRDALYRDFGISDAEAEALADGSIAALERIGVNPILRMHWLMMTDPGAASHMSVTEYLPKFRAGASNG